MAGTFYLSLDCSNCDEPVLYGVCMTTEEHNGHPVIPFDMAAQTTFHCEECGKATYTGDFDGEVYGEDEV